MMFALISRRRAAAYSVSSTGQPISSRILADPDSRPLRITRQPPRYSKAQSADDNPFTSLDLNEASQNHLKPRPRSAMLRARETMKRWETISSARIKCLAPVFLAKSSMMAAADFPDASRYRTDSSSRWREQKRQAPK